MICLVFKLKLKIMLSKYSCIYLCLKKIVKWSQSPRITNRVAMQHSSRGPCVWIHMGDTPSGVVDWVWPQMQIMMPDCGKVFPGGSVVKDLPANAADMGSIPGLGRPLWRREWQPTLVFLPGKKRSLVGYSPWGHKESDATEQLNNNNKKTARPVMSDCRPPSQEHHRQKSL